jgi:hypothetical protein
MFVSYEKVDLFGNTILDKKLSQVNTPTKLVVNSPGSKINEEVSSSETDSEDS